ncbi:MAG: ATP-grasp domain-containing protein [Candidatus Latescibacteria bacterium]|nr:ATP-grasp domain-containing protein [Candidatus Latescibacterota bacterium]
MSLIVIQPSADYAARVCRQFPDALLLATPERAAHLADHPRVVAADLSDPAAALQALETYRVRYGCEFRGLTCFVCDYLPLAGDLAPQLGLPFHPAAAIRLSRDKSRAALAWVAAGVSTPATRLVCSEAELRDFGRRQPGPWILKPTDRSGSEWVLQIDEASLLPDAHRRLHEGLEGAPYLAQRCVKGREFSADVLVEKGEARLLRLTEKYLLPQPGLAGLVGAYFPARVPPALSALLLATFRAGALALGVEHGVVMVDAILEGETPYLLEMALRPGGDCLPDLCIHATGYDPIETACRVALGQTPAASQLDNPAPLAALHLMGTHNGIIRAIDFAALEAHPAVVQLEPYHLPGDELRCWEGSYDDRILAACVARCEAPELLPVLIEELRGLITLELETDPRASCR